MIKTLLATLALFCATTLFGASGNLEIYWIDSEGGAATLIVSPTGESLLIDTANRRPDNSDALRITNTAKMAGLEKIDYVLTTHYHSDHMGALPALVEMFPVSHFLDHGESIEIDRPRVKTAYDEYVAITKGKRTILAAGDKIPLAGVDITVVQSAAKSITKPLPGAGQPNASCASFVKQPAEQDPDNDYSIGFVLKYGDFDFLTLGDLTKNYEQNLVCPANLIGKIDLYQSTHHGLDRSNSAQLMNAIQPAVIVMNNGARKGGPAAVFETYRAAPGLEDIWQGHLATRTPKEVNTDEAMIANLGPTDGCEGHLLKVAVTASGKYTMTNLRNNHSKSYQAK